MLEGARLLDGIRVIDAASFIAGPVAATVMADFGAQVIKVEPPADDTYRLGNAGYPPSPYNFPWIVDNRGKRGLALDLRAEAGQRVLHRLIAGADVFVTNVPLDGRARLGVRWEDLAPLNPRLIYAAPRSGPAAGLWTWCGPRPTRRPRGRCRGWVTIRRGCRSSGRSW